MTIRTRTGNEAATNRLADAISTAGDPMTAEQANERIEAWHAAFGRADELVGHLRGLFGPAATAAFEVEWDTLRRAGDRLTMDLSMQANVARERNSSNQNAMDAWAATQDNERALSKTLDSIRVDRDEWHEDWAIANAKCDEYERTIKGWRRVGIVSERMMTLLGQRTIVRSKKAVDAVRAERSQDALD